MLCNLTTEILDQVLKKFVSSEKNKTKQNKDYNSKIQNKKQEMQL